MKSALNFLNSTIKKFVTNSASRAALAARDIDLLLQKSVQSKNITFQDALYYSWNVTKLVANRPEALMAAAACAVIVLSSGIFMPFTAIDLGQRLTIGIVSTIFATAVAFGLHVLTQPLHLKFGINLWAISIAASVGSSLVFSTVFPVIMWYFSNYMALGFWDLFIPMIAIYGLANSFVLWRIKPYICRNKYKEQSIPQNITAILPTQKRGELLAISAADHYVEITTENGKHLHRMAMKSAVAKTDEDEGLRVHRSHWVAHRAMLSLKKEGERYFLTLRNGDRIPVSSKMAQDVRRYLDKRPLVAAQ